MCIITKKALKKQNDELRNQNDELSKKKDELEKQNNELMKQIDELQNTDTQKEMEKLQELCYELLEKYKRQERELQQRVDEQECAGIIYRALEEIGNDINEVEKSRDDVSYSQKSVLSVLKRDRENFESLLADYLPDEADMSNPYKVEEVFSKEEEAPGKRFGGAIVYHAKMMKK